MNLGSVNGSPASAMDRRADGARQALINAGMELFGERGFKATSTRMLALLSGTNVSAIPYYFGGKEGLYRAVVEHIAARASSYVGPSCIEAKRRLGDGSRPKAAVEALEILFESIFAMFIDSDEPKSWALIIMREQANPTGAFDAFYGKVIRNLHQLISASIAAYAGLDPAGDEAKIRAHALLGQVFVFLSSREAILRQLGVKKLTRRHVGLIYQVLWTHVETAISVPRIEGGRRSSRTYRASATRRVAR